MNPDLLLHILAALAGYLLKTTFAFGLGFICSRLVHSPTKKLAVWLSFLFGSAGYWLWLAVSMFAAGRPASGYLPGTLPPAAPASGVLQLPGSWALPLGLALRAVGGIYVTVLFYLFFKHLKKWWRLQMVVKFTTSAPPAIEKRFRILAEGLGVGHARLLVLTGISSPATFGWIRPNVLLPDICLQQDWFDLEDILLHELHHVRRRDFVWNQLAMACESLTFFQPACRYALRRVNLERELACDLAVVARAPERRATYAECLIRFARLHAAQQEESWGVDFAASPHLKIRVRLILAGSRRLSAWSICLRTACTVALLAGFVGEVPSLAVLLSYTRQLAQPLPHESMTTTLTTTRPGAVNHRRSKSWPARVPGGAQSAAPNPSGAPSLGTAKEDNPETNGFSVAVTSPSGPQLLHRARPGAVTPENTKQQTIALLDPDRTQAGSTTANRKQAIEQTATTALGIYRRLGAVDRH